jgi:tetrahydromethanopterin S-methyltransferase subunit G
MNFFDGPDMEEFNALKKRVSELEARMYRVESRLRIKEQKKRERDSVSDTKPAR